MYDYAVCYDLKSPGQDYDDLHDAIMSYPAYAHPLESMWFIQTDDGADEVRDDLQEHIDWNDRLLVIEVGGSGMWWGTTFKDDHTEWMKNNL